MNNKDIMRIVSEKLEKRDYFVLFTVIHTEGTVASKVGMKMVCSKEGNWGSVGGGIVEMSLINKFNKKLINTGIYEFELTSDKECGGYVKVFAEVFAPPIRILIFGGGHCGSALAELALKAGFDVLVFDSREEVLEKVKDKGVNIVKGKFNNIGDVVKENDYIVIMTPSHRWDSDVLYQILKWGKYGYVGVMGSEKKCEEVHNNIREKGIEESKIEDVHCPIGINICSHTPVEISISVMAEIIKNMNCR